MKLLTRLFSLVVLTLLPVVGIEIYDEIDARSSRANEGKDQALRLVRLVAQEQLKVVEGTHQLLSALARTPAVRDHEVASCSAVFADFVRGYPQYSGFVSTDLTGRPVCVDVPAEMSQFFGSEPYFKSAIATREFALGEYHEDGHSHQKLLYLAQPYDNGDGQLSGVVAAGLSLDWLNNELARSPLPPKATVSVIDRSGTILARYPDSERFVGTRISAQAHSYLLTGGEGVQEALGFDGIPRIFAYTSLPGGPSGLTLSVGLDKGEMLQGVVAANRRDIIVIAGSCVLALLLAGIGARAFISRPIRVLLDAAEHWRQGDLDARVPFTQSQSEFGRLGAAFNSMAAAIGMREQDLERRVHDRTQALEQAMLAQQAAEIALHEARKMETVGRLTGGVAHDFNNLLAAIVGNIELARAHLGPRHPELPRLEAAMHSASRGAALVQQLLAFARQQNLRPEVVDLNGYILGARDMLQRLLGPDVTVETGLSADAGRVRVDPHQLEAAILNLAMNARDAMPNGGQLRLETRNASFAARCRLTGLAGDFVALTVTDTGAGIPPENREKVFDPFFTTKDFGAGSGLGLSMVHGFARQSSGAVSIESEVGQGTSVSLYLPRTTEAATPVSPVAEEPIAGEGTILLVDDDEEVRSVTGQLLELSGYVVISAQNAAEAIACFGREAARIDILITDFLLADGLNGLALAAALRRQRPDLPVLLMTGHSEVLPEQHRVEGVLILTKPFAHAVLAQAVLRAIRSGRQSKGRLFHSTVLT